MASVSPVIDVRERGRLVARNGGDLVVEAPETAAATHTGDSVALDGVCLTATDVSDGRIAFHAVAEMARRLSEAGFRELREEDRWELASGDRCYVVRDGGSIVAFRLGSSPLSEAGARLIGAHTDSPTFKVRPRPDVRRARPTSTPARCMRRSRKAARHSSSSSSCWPARATPGQCASASIGSWASNGHPGWCCPHPTRRLTSSTR